MDVVLRSKCFSNHTKHVRCVPILLKRAVTLVNFSRSNSIAELMRCGSGDAEEDDKATGNFEVDVVAVT